MAVTGIMLLGFVLFHMIGNLKIYLGAAHLDEYAEWLRTIGEPFVPRGVFLWILRVGLIAAFFFHIVSAAQLTRMNHRARPVKYQSPRDYVAADFASRTMRWTGVIVGLFVIFHLMDLTWGTVDPDWVRGDVYDERDPQLPAGPGRDHLHRRQHRAGDPHLPRRLVDVPEPRAQQPEVERRAPEVRDRFALIIGIANVSFPLMVVTGVVDHR